MQNGQLKMILTMSKQNSHIRNVEVSVNRPFSVTYIRLVNTSHANELARQLCSLLDRKSVV